jgi:hypothetical protein
MADTHKRLGAGGRPSECTVAMSVIVSGRARKWNIEHTLDQRWEKAKKKKKGIILFMSLTKLPTESKG